MKRCHFNHTTFVKTAVHVKDYPLLKTPSGEVMPEIAVAGRSNVGKSSLLNHLFREKKLVKVSATPGKTQALNFFSVDEQLGCVDLPGYGFAEVPLEVRAKWGPMIQTYLQTRSSLRLILLLMDVRRIPNDEDKQLLEWIAFHQKAALLVITKIDKVTRQECQKNTARILQEFGCDHLHYTHYSVLKNQGRDQLVRLIHQALMWEEEQIGTTGEG